MDHAITRFQGGLMLLGKCLSENIKKTLLAGGRQAGSLGLTQPHGKRHVDFAH